MKTLLTNLMTSVITLLALFTVLEIGVRLCVDENRYLFSNVSDDWVLDAELGYKNKPDFSEEKRHKDKIVSLSTNADGFQPATVSREKAPGKKRIMLIGNSTVFSRDVPENEKIHSVLDSVLNANVGDFDVVNTGATGYSTDQALLVLEKYIALYKPDYVGYSYCINDLYFNAQDMYTGISKPYFQLAGDSLHLMPSDINKSKLSKETSLKNVVQLSAFYGLLRPYIQRVRMQFSEQAVLDQGGVGNLETYAKSSQEEPLFQLLGKLVERMNETCQQHNARFFLYAHPEVVTVWEPYRLAIDQTGVDPFIIENKLKELAGQDSIEFLGMVEQFLAQKEKGPFHLLPNDPHCNGAGYLIQAGVISDFIFINEQKNNTEIEHQ